MTDAPPATSEPSDQRWTMYLVAGVLLAGLLGFGLGRWGGSGGDGAFTEPEALSPTEIEIGFLQDMSDHHAQAVLMANQVLRHGENETVRQIALDIAGSQGFERGQMAAYLADREAGPGAPDRLTMRWMGGGVPLENMLGYVSQDDLAEFANLRGLELDRRFLELMIEHHQGGAEMAQAAVDRLEDSRIEDMAAQMVLVQTREISDMQLLLG